MTTSEAVDEVLKKQQQMAFPISRKIGGVEISSCGLSKREWFASMALQGIISSVSNAEMAGVYSEVAAEKKKSISQLQAGMAVEFADALIEALKK